MLLNGFFTEVRFDKKGLAIWKVLRHNREADGKQPIGQKTSREKRKNPKPSSEGESL